MYQFACLYSVFLTHSLTSVTFWRSWIFVLISQAYVAEWVQPGGLINLRHSLTVELHVSFFNSFSLMGGLEAKWSNLELLVLEIIFGSNLVSLGASWETMASHSCYTRSAQLPKIVFFYIKNLNFTYCSVSLTTLLTQHLDILTVLFYLWLIYTTSIS